MNLGLKASDEIFNLTVESRFFEYSIFLNSAFSRTNPTSFQKFEIQKFSNQHSGF